MLPLNIFIEGQNLEILPEWKEKIESELARLQKRYNAAIVSTRVEIIGTGHHRQGQFEIRIIATIPGNVLTVTRQGELVHPLIVEAFDVLDRRLQETSDTRQQKVKTHPETSVSGRILRIFPDEDFGFIETAEGDEVYFHANAVKKGKFLQLQVGQKVKLAWEEGLKGPQATWVRLQD
ncbi:MAG: HPF/RaiA family ribosome-associated protein [Deltaproteobacteria bacterium]|nr:HPF/RaiA family ribosome-associated protein [Deltaproteobacteria bacterium]